MHGGSASASTLTTESPATESNRQRIRAAAHIASKRSHRRQSDATDAVVRRDSSLAELDQQGSARIRLPRIDSGPLQAVLLNTAGGLTGDDEICWSATAQTDSHLRISTAACEKLYRTHGPAARQQTHLHVGSGARLDWLPQETIIFDGASLQRRLDAELADDATALIVESIVLGRKASHEAVTRLYLHDRWRIRRNGRLLHAEDLRLDLDNDETAHRAGMLHHYSAIATVLLVSPRPEESFALLRRQLQALSTSATDRLVVASSILPHRLVVRMLAESSLELRRFLIPCIELMNEGLPVPQVWNV